MWDSYDDSNGFLTEIDSYEQQKEMILCQYIEGKKYEI